MRAVKISVASATFLAILIIAALPLSAGVLNGHPNAYFDGVTTWTGNTAYDDGTGTLAGTVDWAVFDAAGFAASGLAGLGGWTTNPGELVYAYQINNTGPAPLASFAVSINNPASNAGAANGALGGTVPSSITIASPGSATYAYTPALATVTSSGLVYNSPNIPMNFFGSVVDTGLSTFVIPLPSPSGTPIPEPTTGLLFALGLGGLAFYRFRRRAQK